MCHFLGISFTQFIIFNNLISKKHVVAKNTHISLHATQIKQLRDHSVFMYLIISSRFPISYWDVLLRAYSVISCFPSADAAFIVVVIESIFFRMRLKILHISL